MVTLKLISPNIVFSKPTGLEHFMIELLNQIFKGMAFIGRISLAGPDPQNGGRLVSMSCIY